MAAERSTVLHVGLDVETSGRTPGHHKILQIGAAFLNGDVFTSDVGWQLHDCPIEVTALQVNGFTKDRIINGPAAGDVDVALHHWLVERGAHPTFRNVRPVGFNVIDFDMDFIAAVLPMTASLLGKGIELNSQIDVLADTVPYRGKPTGYPAWKKIVVNAAVKRLTKQGVEKNLHDAGYDARLAIEARDYISWRIREEMGLNAPAAAAAEPEQLALAAA